MISTEILPSRTKKFSDLKYKDFNIDNFSTGNMKTGADLTIQNIKIVIGVLKKEIVMNAMGIGSNILFKIGTLITSKVLSGIEVLENELYNDIEKQVADVIIDREKSILQIYADDNAMTLNIHCIIDDKSYIVTDSIAF